MNYVCEVLVVTIEIFVKRAPSRTCLGHHALIVVFLTRLNGLSLEIHTKQYVYL